MMSTGEGATAVDGGRLSRDRGSSLLDEEGKKLRDYDSDRERVRAYERKRQLAQYSSAQSGMFLAGGSRQPENFLQLKRSLLSWLQSTLLHHRKMALGNDLFEELQDGYVLEELLDVLEENSSFEHAQSWQEQRKEWRPPAPTKHGTYRLQQAVDRLAITLGSTGRARDGGRATDLPWTVEGLAAGDELCTLRMLIAIIDHYRCPVRLPDNVKACVVHVLHTRSGMRHEEKWEQLTGDRDTTNLAGADPKDKAREKDVFDRWFQDTPEKASEALKGLLGFACDKLRSTHPGVKNCSDFSDGVLLVRLASLLGGYFLRLGMYHQPTETSTLGVKEKTENVRLALELLEEEGVSVDNVAIDGILKGDNCTMARLLYQLRSKWPSS